LDYPLKGLILQHIKLKKWGLLEYFPETQHYAMRPLQNVRNYTTNLLDKNFP